jgi:23S rRNA (adenine2503-C2)-methyltransferase
MTKTPLAALPPEAITAALALRERFRGSQIFRWIQHGAASFQDMSDLPAALRGDLDSRALVSSSSVDTVQRSVDGSVKLRLALGDGGKVEAMALSDGHGRRTACLSTQVGCPMGCAFCRTGLMGFRRNLEAHEIVEQFHHLVREAGPIANVVFMGMGEPLLNLPNVARAVETLHHPEGAGLGLRKFTLSTSGIAAGIAELAANGPAIRLAVSLVSAVQRTRASLMPVARSTPLPALKEALLRYQERTGDRVTLEMVMLEGITDGSGDADALIAFVPPLSVMVNLIPWNPTPEIPFREPSPESVRRFRSRLEGAGIPVAERMRKGRDLDGACGQLAVLPDRQP